MTELKDPDISHVDVAAQSALFQMVTGARLAQAIYVAAALQIADFLADGPQTVAELSEITRTHAQSLYRLLRALASVGIFAEGPDGAFCLNSMGNLLRSDLPGTLWAAALHFNEPYWWRTTGDMLHSVQTGEPAPPHLYGMDTWEYLAQHPETAAIFNNAMTANSDRQLPAILEAFDFSDIGTLIDIAGGRGALLAGILRAYPAMRGILFDLPEVVTQASAVLAPAGVEDRCLAVGGDFFGTLPQGGDAYLLKQILHDWDDEQASRILANIRRTMVPTAKLLLVEHVILPGNEPQVGKLLDLTMLVQLGGRERTSAEWQKLLADSGFALQRIVPTRAGVSIIEAWPTES
jgi:hypothetical protein